MPPTASSVQQATLRERLIVGDAASLSDAEILALLLDSHDQEAVSAADALLQRFGGLAGLLNSVPHDLVRTAGLGVTQGARVVAAAELHRRLSVQAASSHPIIRAAADAAHLCADMRGLHQEHVRVILLDPTRRAVAMPTVYIGTLNASVLRVSEIFREAIVRNSPAFVLVHNHPAGSANPSPEDVEITRLIDTAGRLLDIALVDHVIIGANDWVSLRDLGLGFDT